MNNGRPSPPPEPTRDPPSKEPLSLSYHDAERSSGVGSSRTSPSPTRNNGRGLKSRGLGAIRRSNSSDDTKGMPSHAKQQQSDVMDAVVTVASQPHATKRSHDDEPTPQPGVGGAPQGKIRSTVAVTKPGAVSVIEPSAVEPSAVTGVGGAPQGKMRRADAIPSKPGATSVVEPGGGAFQAALRPGAASVVEPSPAGRATGVGGAPQGKMKARVAATRPGAVSVTAPAALEPGGATGVGGAPQGKMRRTTAPVEVKPGAINVVEPSSLPAHVTNSRYSMNNSFSSLNAGSSHSQNPRGLRSSRNDLRGSSSHHGDLRKSRGDQSKGSSVEEAMHDDPQAIRRKQIQEIMIDATLNQHQKQAQIQQLMAGGMPKPGDELPNIGTLTEETVAGEDAEKTRRKEIQEIMKDSALSQLEKHTKIQQLVPSGIPKSSPPKSSKTDAGHSGEDPQTIRRKQIQEIMQDSSLTPQEKHSRVQQLMASGMPKVSSPSVASTNDLTDSSVEHQGSDEASDPSAGKNHDGGALKDVMEKEDDYDGEDERQRRENEAIMAIMMDPTLTNREKQLKTQYVLANGVQEEEEADRENQEILEIMMDATLTAREKQLKTQEVLANGVLNTSSNHTSASRGSATRQHRSVSPGPQRKRGPRGLGVQRSNTGGSHASARAAGLRRARPAEAPGVSRSNTGGSQSSGGSAGLHRGLRRIRSSESQQSSNSNSTGPCRISNQDLNLSSGSNHSEVSMDSFHDDIDGMNEDIEDFAAARTTDAQTLHTSTGVRGAPQGNMGRTTGSATKPGVVSVPGTSNEPSSVATGVGGAPQGKIRRGTSPASRPGAVSVVEPATGSAEPRVAVGVGGAPQGKMRRGTSPASRPGAVSVVEPAMASAEPKAAYGVGGAPQGKMRRTTAAADIRPGAVSVASVPSEPSAESAPTQGKMRGATVAAEVRPGAVSVAPAPSEPGAVSAPTGVGGAPQGKIRRTTLASEVRPGAVSVAPAPSEPGAESAPAGVGGAPQGKMRRTTAPAEARPGAVCVAPAPSEPGAPISSGVGGAPQGKMGRTIAPAEVKSGIVIAATLPPEPVSGPTGVGGAPQGKSRRTTTTSQASTPGAVSVVEPNTALSEPGASSGVGGAPQGKARRAGTSPGFPGTATTEPTAPPTMLARAQTAAQREPILQPTMLTTSKSMGASVSAASAAERDMLAKSSACRARPQHNRPGAQAVEAASQPEPAGSGVPDNSTHTGAIQASGNGLSSTPRSLPTVSEEADFNHAVKLVEDDLDIKMRLRAEAKKATVVQPSAPAIVPSPSQLSFRGSPEDDFIHAVKLVEDDLAIKMRLRAEAQTGTVAGVRTDVLGGQASMDDYNDVEMQTEKEKEASRSEPASMQSRMQYKVLQMEQEQRARDDKLEELEEMQARGRVSERFKVAPDPFSPTADVFNDESEPIENGFLNPDPEAIRRAEEDGLAIAIAVDEDEEPDVYDVELKMYDPKSKPPLYQNRRFRCYAALICLLTTAAVVIVGLLAAKRGEVIYITHAPSASPSMPPTTTRETAVRGELARVIGDMVNEPATPYDQAMDWILYEDPLQLDEFAENLIQRYILALFYYQTSQDHPWTSCNKPEDGEDYTCLYYDFTRKENTMEAPYYVARNTTEVRWLSERHECEWAQVLCHPVSDGDVIGLDILGQNLTGTLPEELQHLERLMWLSLSYNNFAGTIPEVYGEFPYMTIFEITGTLLTGQLPGGFFRLSTLLQLNPAFTLISGTIPPEIGDLTTLHSLFWFSTDIVGTLPTEMGLMEDVRNIWMFDNSGLSGTIPSEIGQLSLLEDLKLANNGHSGPLPSEIGLLTNMEEFLIAGNNMGGTSIPEELWNMTNTIYLDFNGAAFGGTISTRIGQMTKLKGLKASRNFFSGTIPSEIGLLDDLLLLWVHVNENLGGSVPIEVCMLKGPDHLQYLNADCRGSPARISCQCCTGCCDEFAQCLAQ